MRVSNVTALKCYIVENTIKLAEHRAYGIDCEDIESGLYEAYRWLNLIELNCADSPTFDDNELTCQLTDYVDNILALNVCNIPADCNPTTTFTCDLTITDITEELEPCRVNITVEFLN